VQCDRSCNISIFACRFAVLCFSNLFELADFHLDCFIHTGVRQADKFFFRSVFLPICDALFVCDQSDKVKKVKKISSKNYAYIIHHVSAMHVHTGVRQADKCVFSLMYICI
jgi:hypothetical protein